MEHQVARRPLRAVSQRDRFRQHQEHIQVGCIKELDDLDIRLPRARLVREMQAERIVVEAGDEIAKRPVRARVHHFAVGHAGGDHAHLPFTQAKFLTWKGELGRTVQLQENLRAVMIVHAPAVFE